MLRLRTSTGLSLLALTVGVAGTAWLSSLTAGWQGPAARLGVVHHTPWRHALPSQARRYSPISAVRMPRIVPERRIETPLRSAPAELVPQTMPDDSSQSWAVLRGHLDGRVVAHLDIDGSGRVRAAHLVESSGDPVLDMHALRSVEGWHFAVPADHVDGISGDLPMRFSSGDQRTAQLP
jgi:protein TonB